MLFDIPITRIRNIGIMAHIDAGKTTCAERILFFTGRIRKTGEVHHGNAVLDFDPLEQKRGITINAAATSVAWRDHVIQLVDTPGHVDFTIEVERSLRVLDGAVFVLDAGSGVECQSETVFRQAEKHGVPCIAFVNKVDKVGADFDACLVDIRERLGVAPLAIHRPIVSDEGIAVVDIVRRVLVRFDAQKDGRVTTLMPVPDAMRDALEAHRRALVERCAEIDEDVLDAFCAGHDVPDESLVRALRKGTLARAFLVVTCGSALKNVGIQTLLDAVVDYLPSPRDRHPHDDGPLVALAFKTVAERNGRVTFVRVYAGEVTAGARVAIGGDERDRIGRIHLPHAGEREEIERAGPGAIVAVTGLRSVRTGDTISAEDHPIVLPRIVAPEPVVEIAIEPKTAADRDRLPGGLARLAWDDPSLSTSYSEETGQTRLRGMGKLHLEVAVDKLLRDHGVAVSLGKPRVAYRETIGKPATATHRLVKQSGGSGQFACVTLAIVPLPRGAGITFADETTGGVVPRDFVPAVEKGVRAAAARGVFAGHPVVDVAVALTDGAAHAKDSSALAFEIAGSLAFQDAVRAAGLVLLEPIAALEITIPEASSGVVIGDLGSRRGLVDRIAPRGALLVIEAHAPLSETFDYVPELRGITHGRGSAIVKPAGYEPAPASVTKAVAV